MPVVWNSGEINGLSLDSYPMDKGNSNFFVKFLKENKGNNNHEKKDLDRILKICELGDPNQQMLKLFQQTVYNPTGWFPSYNISTFPPGWLAGIQDTPPRPTLVDLDTQLALSHIISELIYYNVLVFLVGRQWINRFRAQSQKSKRIRRRN